MDRLRIVKVKNVKTPSFGTNGSCGLDFYVPDNFNPLSIISMWPLVTGSKEPG